MPDDADLLRRFIEENSEEAFAGLVRRHIALVYSVALRQVAGDVQLAEDVVQHVFTALARKASRLVDRPALSGWLYRSTHFAASDMVRSERRRRARETEAHLMHEIDLSGVDESHVDWEKIRPSLDDVIAGLDESDRDAVSLRFFDGCSFGEIGARLRLTENAARMRVERALDKMYGALSRKGIKSTSAAVAVVLAHQVSATPSAALADAVTVVAMANATAASATVPGGRIVSSTSAVKIGVVIMAAALVVLFGFGLMELFRTPPPGPNLANEQAPRNEVQIQSNDPRTRVRPDQPRDRDTSGVEPVRTVVDVISPPATRDGRTRMAPLQDGRTAGSALEVASSTVPDAPTIVTATDLPPGSAAAGANPLDEFNRLLDEAETHRARGEMQLARLALSRALQVKPTTASPSTLRRFRAALVATGEGIDLVLHSDGNTWVSITNYRTPAKFDTTVVKMLSGDYEILGRRKGYRDVQVLISVREGVPLAPVSVACTVASH